MLTFNGTLNPGEELIINLQDYTAKIGTTNALKFLEGDFLIYIESGTNTVTYTGDVPATLTIEYNERWR